MLASSIDFKVEFQLVALVQLTHPGAFDCTDVHERIGLPVVTGDKAKALHGVEELDRAGRLFASQLALRRRCLGRGGNYIANNLQIGRGNFSAAIDQVEFQLLPFGQALKTGAFDRADVYKHIFATVFALNEAKTLLGVEELHDALAGADYLGGHAAATATAGAATGAAEAAATAATTRAAAKATAITAAETATVTAAKTAAITATEATAITAKAATTATAAETTIGVEIVFAETVALVASATPPSVKTHRNR
jgi:hypothetical protein